ncbi:uncharacterized protein LOC122497953 [Leptopilina heterotoma]|uniref:uncharacterized protein LOC122497953 n=1 Tax=Leptopilina heterotoma TaxID=63436 RepID=UPI001CA9EF23|nr:uncharacterized protein LOC122497953 [Leptopilina heterotoma]
MFTLGQSSRDSNAILEESAVRDSRSFIYIVYRLCGHFAPLRHFYYGIRRIDRSRIHDTHVYTYTPFESHDHYKLYSVLNRPIAYKPPFHPYMVAIICCDALTDENL